MHRIGEIRLVSDCDNFLISLPRAILMLDTAPLQSDTRNKVLASLPEDEFRNLSPLLHPVALKAGGTLHEAEEKIASVYFVEEGLVSLLSVLEDGASIEIGIVGREGVSDVSVLLGSEIAAHQALVQIEGRAFRLSAADAREAFRLNEQLRQRLLRFTRLLLAQTALTAACNAMHGIEERLARWLLVCHQRVGSELLPLTHEFLSHMLGVRRSGVTVAAGILQRAGLIRYSRKDIVIVDREGLELASCECFKLISAELAWYIAD